MKNSLAIALVMLLLNSVTYGNPKIVFPKRQIRLGQTTLLVEVANTPEQLTQGLMFRQKLGSQEGMLFVYKDEEVLHFWMKNTFIPLSIGFFDRNRKLIDIHEMLPVKSEMQIDIPTYKSAGPAQYALELPAGWFKKNKVHTGTKFEFLNSKEFSKPISGRKPGR